MSRDHGQLVNVVLSRMVQLDDVLKMKFVFAREKNMQMVSEIIDYGISVGRFRDSDSRLIALMFKGTFAQANMERILAKHMEIKTDESTAFNETTETLFQIFINLIKS